MKRLSKITESIWSDIQDRSMGKNRRREDDVDLLDETGLVNYMKKVYMPPSSKNDKVLSSTSTASTRSPI